MSNDVFLSVGKTSTPEQERFVSAIEDYLKLNGLNPRAVGRNEFSSEQPLKLVDRLMNECSGVVILAFERIHIERAVEGRGGKFEKPVSDQNLPTVWNQIEAAQAYVLKRPLLVIAEHGLRSEGLIEIGYDWYVQWVGLDPAALNTREFVGVFTDWKTRVEEFAGRRNAQASKARGVNPETLTLGEIVRALKPAQLWAIVVALVGAVAALAGVAFKLGSLAGR